GGAGLGDEAGDLAAQHVGEVGEVSTLDLLVAEVQQCGAQSPGGEDHQAAAAAAGGLPVADQVGLVQHDGEGALRGGDRVVAVPDLRALLVGEEGGAHVRSVADPRQRLPQLGGQIGAHPVGDVRGGGEYRGPGPHRALLAAEEV